MFDKILVMKKMSPLEFYYKGKSKSRDLIEMKTEEDENMEIIQKILSSYKKEFKIITRDELKNEKMSDYDLIISAGGDGTVIASAAYNQDVPQLNLRLDKRSRGALCNHNLEEALLRTLEGKYNTENWARQDVFLDGKFLGRTLNEVCVGENLKFSKMAVYEMEFSDLEGKTQNDFHENSGLIIVSGSGSSAWGKNFQAYSRESSVFSFLTVMPNRGDMNSGKGTYFKLVYKHHEGKIALDTIEYDFPRDSVLEIKLSEHPLRILHPIC